MDVNVKDVSVHGKRCVGCVRRTRDVMVSVNTTNMHTFVDFFLTKEQAQQLVTDIAEILVDNEKTRNINQRGS